MPSNSQAYNPYSRGPSTPELSYTPSTRQSSATSSYQDNRYAARPAVYQSSHLAPPRRDYSPSSASSSASGSSASYEIPPRSYEYTLPNKSRDDKSKSKKVTSYANSSSSKSKDSKPTLIHKGYADGGRDYTDSYVRSKNDDGRYHPESGYPSKSGSSRRKEADERERYINGKGKGKSSSK